MKLYTGALLALLGASAAQAGGIERTTQSAMILYQKGNRVELSFGRVMPKLSGVMADSQGSGDIANDFTSPSLALKMDVSDTLALAFIYDKPFGSDVVYADGPSGILLGQSGQAETRAMTFLAKYQATDRVSVFGGLRVQESGGSTILDGAPYDANPLVTAYDVTFGDDWGTGYVLGAAYEIPEIALRLALTYNSEVKHSYDTTEIIGGTLVPGSKTKSVTPQSVNLEFQTGLNQRTLLMASARWVDHSAFKLHPAVFDRDLVSLRDTTTYRIGIGRAFSQKLSGSVTYAFEPKGSENVSSLSPSNGYKQLSLGLAYKATEALELSGGITYRVYGDANATVGGAPVGRFEDNSLTGVGLKVAYSF
ncbi:OmpP1/FadL family transporter [Pseudooceanicola sp. 200-1SW]|uniref:OmpP1/FadL family transporter n=1 Tax=Pseudooceanicola sp. 200-1SW TaxID=3425949 RepID=UPI003D7F8539